MNFFNNKKLYYFIIIFLTTHFFEQMHILYNDLTTFHCKKIQNCIVKKFHCKKFHCKKCHCKKFHCKKFCIFSELVDTRMIRKDGSTQIENVFPSTGLDLNNLFGLIPLHCCPLQVRLFFWSGLEKVSILLLRLSVNCSQIS